MYKGRTFNREITYTCGKYLDGSIFPCFQKPGVRRKKTKPTSATQTKLNETNAIKLLARMINANFVKNDYEMTLTYDDEHEPENYEQAYRDAKNMMRRVKRAWKAAGIERELKYCYREDVGEDGRWHIHVYLTGGLSRDALEELWGKGWANTVRMVPRNDGFTGIAGYIGGKERTSYRRWKRSKNFIVPEPQTRDGAFNRARIREILDAFEEKRVTDCFEALYPGYRLVEARFDHNGINHGYYIYFQMVHESAYINTKLSEYTMLRDASLFMRGMTRKREKKTKTGGGAYFERCTKK